MLKARSGIKNEDEVDLVALVKELWTQKLLIFGFTVLGVALAYAYVSLSKSPPVYEAKIYVLPPAQSGVAAFNVGRSANDEGLKPFTVKEVYAVFTQNLVGETLRQDFFKEVYLPSLPQASRENSVDQLYKTFAEQLVVSADKGVPDRYSVTVQSQDSKQAASWGEAYLDRAAEAAKAEIILNIKQEALVRADDLQSRIASLRESALLKREDRISQLREALSIAKAIGLVEPQLPSSASVTVKGSVNESLAYRRGSKALAAEIEVLQSRSSDDAFVPELRKLQGKYEELSRLNVDPAKVSVSRQDGEVEVPSTPLKTKKNLILLAGLIAGLLLGVFLALVRIFLLRPPESGNPVLDEG